MKLLKPKLIYMLIFFVVLIFPSSCSNSKYYTTKVINPIESNEIADMFYTQVNAKDNYKKIILNALIGNDSKEIFSIESSKQLGQRPEIKISCNNVILFFNNISYDEQEVFKDNKNNLYEERMNTDSVVLKYSFKSNIVENITPKNQNNKLILDMFEYNNEIFTVYENGIFKNNDKVYSKPIIENSPLRTKGAYFNDKYVFASLDGIYSFETADNSTICILKKSYRNSDFVKVIRNGEFYYVINQVIQPYTTFSSKKTNVTIEKYDDNFSIIQKTDFIGNTDTVCEGKDGFVISYLSQNQIKEYVIKSNYIAFDSLNITPLNDYLITYEIYNEFYKSGSDKMDKNSFYNLYEFATGEYLFTPIWKYSSKLNQFLFVEPHQNVILFNHNS